MKSFSGSVVSSGVGEALVTVLDGSLVPQAASNAPTADAPRPSAAVRARNSPSAEPPFADLLRQAFGFLHRLSAAVSVRRASAATPLVTRLISPLRPESRGR